MSIASLNFVEITKSLICTLNSRRPKKDLQLESIIMTDYTPSNSTYRQTLKALFRPMYRDISYKIGRLKFKFGPPFVEDDVFAEQPVDLRQLPHIRREYFPNAGPNPWLDRTDANERVTEDKAKGLLTQEQAELCVKWQNDGFVVLPNLLSHDEINHVWQAYENAVSKGVVPLNSEKVNEKDPHPGRFLNPHLLVPEIREILNHPKLKEWVTRLIGREITPFQTITAHKGSQQDTHSDAIHMTTYPLGYMTAAWIACEDIHPDSGPLVYYPGSHRLPYYLSHEVGIKPGEFRKYQYQIYTKKYEPFIAKLISDQKLKPAYLHAKKGDVLIWHHNLLHGGSPRKNILLSRKSIVCHYFVKGAICYHDLAGALVAK